MTTTTVRWGDTFTLDLPPPWVWSDDEGTVTVYRPDGVGALQISILTPEKPPRSRRDDAKMLAESFARQRLFRLAAPGIKVRTEGDSAVSEFEHTEHGDSPAYWQVWHVVGPAHAAFITYTCDPEDAGSEAQDREKILASFRWV